ncbi:hypothetical protein [Salinifilum ghardaiensis]
MTSYAPLFAIFAARSTPEHWWPFNGGWWPFLIWTVLAVVGILDGFRLVRGTTRKSAIPVTLVEVKEHSTVVAGYLATYLLPFVAAPPKNAGDWVGYAIYFLVLLTVFVRSDFAVINPTLYLAGRQVVSATRTLPSRDEPGHSATEEVLVICRHPPRPGATVPLVHFVGCWVTKIDKR